MDDLYDDPQVPGSRHQEIERMLADADEAERRILGFPDNETPIEYPSPELEFVREVETAQAALGRAHQIANRCRSIDPADADWLVRSVWLGAAEDWIGRAMAVKGV